MSFILVGFDIKFIRTRLPQRENKRMKHGHIFILFSSYFSQIFCYHYYYEQPSPQPIFFGKCIIPSPIRIFPYVKTQTYCTHLSVSQFIYASQKFLSVQTCRQTDRSNIEKHELCSHQIRTACVISLLNRVVSEPETHVVNDYVNTITNPAS